MKLHRLHLSPTRVANQLLQAKPIRSMIRSMAGLALKDEVTTLHCVGDSHIRYFTWAANHRIWFNTRFSFFQVPGATAMGMANPNSRTNALNSFSEYLAQAGRRECLLFSLGEVDCGFVIWYRARKYGESVQEQLARSFGNYVDFVDGVVRRYGARIIISSVPLPTIRDGQDWGEVANLRKEVKASLKERTRLTLIYNDMLKSYCTRAGHHFLDYTSPTMDLQTGVVAERFLERNPLDHHLDSASVAPLIVKELEAAGFS